MAAESDHKVDIAGTEQMLSMLLFRPCFVTKTTVLPGRVYAFPTMFLPKVARASRYQSIPGDMSTLQCSGCVLLIFCGAERHNCNVGIF